MAAGQFPPDAVDFCGARVYRSTVQSIPTGTTTNILFNLKDFDTNSIHTISNTDRLYLNRAGYWLIQGGVGFEPNVTGGRQILLRINDLNIDCLQWVPTNVSGSTLYLQAHSLYLTTVTTNYAILQVYQNSGSSLNVVAGVTTWFSATWLGV